MARSQSPGYPQFALPKAIIGVRQIFAADRRNPIDRVVAQKHIGYSGQSGAADKALATLAHYGLIERVGKGEVRVSQRAVDIIHPDTPENRKRALLEAGFYPQIFKDLRERFGNHVSENALQSYLVRENFLDRAIGPVTKAYLDTCRYLEQEEAFESRGAGDSDEGESDPLNDEAGDEMEQVVGVDQRKPNPPPAHTPPPVKQGMRQAVFPLDEGDVTLVFPADLSVDGYEELSSYLDIFLKKAKKQKAAETANDASELLQ